MAGRYGPDAVTDFNRQWLQDLRNVAFRSSTVYGAYCDLHKTYTPDVVRTIYALRREQHLLAGRFHFPA